MPGLSRWSISEYGPPTDLVGEMSAASGQTRARVIELLRSAGERAGHALRFSDSPLLVSGYGVRATDFAGLLRVGPGLELEVVPKFLGGGGGSWREDFFYLAMLSRHGHLLGSERLRALTSPSADLATLVGRALAQMYWDHHRRPIRTYRKRVQAEFALDGDFDPVELGLPNPDGFEQAVLRYDRSNHFNATLRAAAERLVPIVRDRELRQTLERMSQRLGPQDVVARPRTRRMPSRYRQWTPTFDLALDVLSGFGLTFEGGYATAPGFVLDTWRVWEDVLTLALRAALGGGAVAAQKGFALGERHRQSEGTWGSVRDFAVTPDIHIHGSSAGMRPVLLDAKYKGRVDRGRQRIDEADVYEAFAFSTAAGIDQVVLLYPRIADSAPGPVGQTNVLEKVTIKACEIWGLEVEVRGISASGGLADLSNGLLSALRTIAPSATTAIA